MRDGFIKAAAMTPEVKVADPYFNAERIMELMDEAEENGSKITVFPELCITGYTCSDLFLQDSLLEAAKDALLQIIAHSDGMDGLWFVGLPYEHDNKLYNVAAVINCGELLGLVPKTTLPMYGEFYEGRNFEKGNDLPVITVFDGQEIPFGTDILFRSDAIQGLCVAVEICEDLWVPQPPSVRHCLAGASIIVNLSASNETIGKNAYRETLIKSQSGRLCCGYIYANAGYGESTQDLVFGGANLIAENGSILAESQRFTNEGIYADIDIQRIRLERRRMASFSPDKNPEYMIVDAAIVLQETWLDRSFDRKPFVPDDLGERAKRCEEILSIQAMGLAKRMDHTGCKKALIGLSGGLDSTLALLVIVKAFEILKARDEDKAAALSDAGSAGKSADKEAGKEEKNSRQIIAVTMPGFGTTSRTRSNAEKLAECLGAELRTVDITSSMKQHFKDIELPEDDRSVTYENAQARERTQILMDLANKEGGMVIGTGDLSELALGWATYNGDHMSMYGVNGGVPKTLVRHLVRYFADTCGSSELSEVLYDVLDTPVSPELLPPTDGEISQKTEDLVGPYELHDFFLYYMLRWGFSPSKIYRMACETFCRPDEMTDEADEKTEDISENDEGIKEAEYDSETVLYWLKVFYRRFFAQQFKRSCLPDGPKVGSVSVSPRGDLRMPSDACARVWMEELEQM